MVSEKQITFTCPSVKLRFQCPIDAIVLRIVDKGLQSFLQSFLWLQRTICRNKVAYLFWVKLSIVPSVKNHLPFAERKIGWLVPHKYFRSATCFLLYYRYVNVEDFRPLHRFWLSYMECFSVCFRLADDRCYSSCYIISVCLRGIILGYVLWKNNRMAMKGTI